MKVLLVISFLLSTFYFSSYDSHCDHHNKEKYLKAWNYIKVDSTNIDKTIYIFDSIVDLDKFFFWEDINRVLGENKSVEDYFKFERQKNQYSLLLASLFADNKDCSSDKILVFSDIDNNIIIADVLDRKSNLRGEVDKYTTISWADRFTQGYSYLFIFDEDGAIKYVSRLFIETD